MPVNVITSNFASHACAARLGSRRSARIAGQPPGRPEYAAGRTEGGTLPAGADRRPIAGGACRSPLRQAHGRAPGAAVREWERAALSCAVRASLSGLSCVHAAAGAARRLHTHTHARAR